MSKKFANALLGTGLCLLIGACADDGGGDAPGESRDGSTPGLSDSGIDDPAAMDGSADGSHGDKDAGKEQNKDDAGEEPGDTDPTPAAPEKIGNGTLDEGEQCDDGNLAAGDGCGEASNFEEGFSCDTTKAPTVCTAVVCGNGRVEVDSLGTFEECDDGNPGSGDGCSDSCQYEAGFACSGSSPTVCKEVVCGDGRVETDAKNTQEACDDGNPTSGDGCSSSCTLEAGFACTCTGAAPCKTVCTKIQCGDGVVAAGEQCEDGNSAAGDGCSDSCQVEPNWKCYPGNPVYVCTGTDCNDPHPGAHMQKCDLRDRVIKADMTGADLRGAYLLRTSVAQSNFSNADLSGAAGADMIASGAKFTGANLKGAALGGTFYQADFTGADLTGAILRGTFSSTKFNGAKLAGANLDGVVAAGCDFTNATMTNASLFKAELIGAIFNGVTMQNASLRATDLTRATAKNANFTGTTFFGANVQQLNLDGCDLTNANFNTAQGKIASDTGAIYKNTTCPGNNLSNVSCL